MSDGTTLVQRAGRKIGAHSIVNPMDASDVEDGKLTLDSMLQTWLSDGIDIRFTPIDASGEEINEPPDTTNAIIHNLAVLMAPDFDVTISPTLQRIADSEYHKIKDLYEVIDIPKKKVSRTLPVGAGNRAGVGTSTFFDNDDSELES